MEAFYTTHGRMTSPGRHKAFLDGLPSGIGALSEVAQGLVIHEFLTQKYGFELSAERRATVHVRPVEEMLDRIVAEDSRRLTAAREPSARFVGDCRHFTVLTVAMLRAQGTPARARCGFGGYFGSGMFEDHWVCEYWDNGAGRWVLADAQLDETQRRLFGIDFDPLDVPRDRFVVAGQAWAQCRAGEADPASFGLSMLEEGGDWWIAANVVRDVAALNNMEMLPWDSWGVMPKPGEPIDDDRVALFDRLAALTRDPDFPRPRLTEMYESDDRLRVPGTVFNAVRGHAEDVTPAES
jgi:Transglutaminase-like superfamily